MSPFYAPNNGGFGYKFPINIYIQAMRLSNAGSRAADARQGSAAAGITGAVPDAFAQEHGVYTGHAA
jgi:hypothetical protein